MNEDADTPQDDEPNRQLAIRPNQAGGTMSVAEVSQRIGLIEDCMRANMKPGMDYGVIPGTGSKPTLLKPGAEKLALMFRLDSQYETKKEYSPDGHLTVDCYCTIYHAPSGDRLGGASAVCSSRESKYAFRKGERVCPACKKPAIIKGKEEYGGGWVCFWRKEGCGAKFEDKDPDIVGQNVDKVANDNLSDSWNTVVRMGEKRAYLAAIRLVTGCSAIFDEPHGDNEEGHHAAPAQNNQPPQQQRQQAPRNDGPQLACPECGKVEPIIKSKPEYGGGYVCWKKKGGCGAQFGGEASDTNTQAKQPSKPTEESKLDSLCLSQYNEDLVSCTTLDALGKAWGEIPFDPPYKKALAKVKDDCKAAIQAQISQLPDHKKYEELVPF